MRQSLGNDVIGWSEAGFVDCLKYANPNRMIGLNCNEPIQSDWIQRIWLEQEED